LSASLCAVALSPSSLVHGTPRLCYRRRRGGAAPHPSHSSLLWDAVSATTPHHSPRTAPLLPRRTRPHGGVRPWWARRCCCGGGARHGGPPRAPSPTAGASVRATSVAWAAVTEAARSCAGHAAGDNRSVCLRPFASPPLGPADAFWPYSVPPPIASHPALGRHGSVMSVTVQPQCAVCTMLSLSMGLCNGLREEQRQSDMSGGPIIRNNVGEKLKKSVDYSGKSTSTIHEILTIVRGWHSCCTLCHVVLNRCSET